MTASLEEALELFNKWKSEETLLLVTAEGRGFAFRFVGSISEVDPSGVVVSRKADEGEARVTDATLGLQGVVHFEYLDLREAPEAVKQGWARVLMGTLGIELPDSRWAFHELEI